MNPIKFSCLTNFLPRTHALRCASSNDTSTKVTKLLLGRIDPDSDTAQHILNLTQNLIAIKRLFPKMLHKAIAALRLFDLHAPLQTLQVDQSSITRLLHAISPHLTDEDISTGIWKILKDSNFSKRDRENDPDPILQLIDPEIAPDSWPTEAMLFVLSMGNWDKIDLSKANLAGANLRDICWQGANLSDCDLRYANLRHANMRSALLDNTDLRDADMTGVDASQASFIKARFENTKLQYTQFIETTLDSASGITCEEGTDFSDAKLKHAQISIQNMHPWHEGNFLAPVMHDFRKHQLIALSSISEDYNTLYKKILLDLIEASKDERPLLPKINCFTRELLISRRCWNDPQIYAFLLDVLLPPLLEHWNLVPRHNDEPFPEHILIFLSETKPLIDWPRYCGALSQLQVAAQQTWLTSHRTVLQRLFLAHPEIAPVAKALEAIEDGLSELCSIFISPDRSQAIAYENTTLKALSRHAGSPYNGYQFNRDAQGQFQNEPLRDLNAINACAIPLALYKLAIPSETSIALIDYIFDNTIYKDKFINALTCKTLPPGPSNIFDMRISLADDILLIAHLTRFYKNQGKTKKFQASQQHVDHLWQIFDKVMGPVADTIANRARMLLCLGTMFVSYSSASLFGTEYDSLISLRTYAWACLSQAHALDASLLNLSAIDIEKNLLGAEKDISQCAETQTIKLLTIIHDRVLSDAMLEICFAAIYPQAWE